MEKKDAILEIGCEEIPASYLRPAAEQLRAVVRESLAAHGLSCGEARLFYTPRRIALLLRDVPEMQESLEKVVTGPPVSVAYDEKGNPTRAAEGFARAQGVSVSGLVRRKTPKGEVVAALKREGGRPAVEILAEVFPGAVSRLKFPKVMRWGDGDFLFARPIRWILAVHSRSVVPFRLAGLPSGRETRGLRASGGGPLELEDASQYLGLLRSAGILADPEERRNAIRTQVEEAARARGGRVLEDPGLLEDVCHLVEAPVAASGGFDPAYLELPSPVIVTAMREHQKYFAVVDEKGGLLPCFITVMNGTPRDRAVVVRSNEAVLRARLEDAKFFWQEDLKKPLSEWAWKLSGITWIEGLGTLADKAVRLERLVVRLARLCGLKETAELREAARLCKADLATNMVREKEFTSLQGIMGGLYAAASGRPEVVGRAIGEHYRPRWAGDPLPETAEGALLSVADKLDNLAGCFRAGLVPSGSQDPFALRRQTVGVLQILLDRRWSVELVDLVRAAQGGFQGRTPAKETERILEFVRGRVATVLESEGVPYDVAAAVGKAQPSSFLDEVERARAAAQAKHSEAFRRLATAAGRVLRILPEEKRLPKFSRALAKFPEERALADAVEACRRRLQGLLLERAYDRVLETLSELEAPVHAFFEKVLVMDKNAKIRNNRLALLRSAADCFLAFCDFREIVFAQSEEAKKGKKA